MYVWQVEKLKIELAEGPLPQSEQFKYLLAYSLLIALPTIPMGSYNNHDLIESIVALLMTPLGLAYVYHCNGGGRGERLFERYFSLVWVVFIRMLAMVALPMFLGVVILKKLLDMNTDGTDTVDTVAVLALEVVTYYLLGKHIRSLRLRKGLNGLGHR